MPTLKLKFIQFDGGLAISLGHFTADFLQLSLPPPLKAALYPHSDQHIFPCIPTDAEQYLGQICKTKRNLWFLRIRPKIWWVCFGYVFKSFFFYFFIFPPQQIFEVSEIKPIEVTDGFSSCKRICSIAE